MAIDFLLGEADDLVIQNGDFVIGESLTQEVAIILRSSQGEFKSDPLIGANLIQLIDSAVDDDNMRSRIKLHLQRDDKNYEEIKELINLNKNLL